ncbi:MAG TPA: TadE/TadG family type IV pilus assembly protein [Terriglobia bacterium]|nr:TadE/TadG family type IV pilus assembly protein [Terriglobia bacterium]
MLKRMNLKSRIRNFKFGRRLGIKSESGQAIIEMAVILPVAIGLLVGIAEIGRYANESIVVSHAARAGVQYAAQNRVTASSNSQIIQAAMNDAPSLTNMTVTPSHYCTCADGTASTCTGTDCSGSRIIEYVKVDTQVQMPNFISYPGFPQSFTVKGEKIMRVSQ